MYWFVHIRRLRTATVYGRRKAGYYLYIFYKSFFLIAHNVCLLFQLWCAFFGLKILWKYTDLLLATWSVISFGCQRAYHSYTSIDGHNGRTYTTCKVSSHVVATVRGGHSVSVCLSRCGGRLFEQKKLKCLISK